MRILAVLLAGLFLLPAWAPRQSAAQEAVASSRLAEVLEGVEAFRREVTELTGSFRQIREPALLGTSIESAGEFYYRQPDELLLEYSEPQEGSLLVRGRDVWIYFPDEGKASHYGLGHRVNLEGLFAGLGGSDSGELLEGFEISLEVDLPDEVTLRLVPRPEVFLSGDLAGVDLVVETTGYLPVSIRLLGLAGDILEFRLSDLAINSGLDPSLFEFSPPEGVPVIDHRTP